MSIKKSSDQPIMDVFSNTTANLSTAIRSAWRGRERGLAVFAGVFLASLVITTVFAYGVGLSQSALQALALRRVGAGREKRTGRGARRGSGRLRGSGRAATARRAARRARAQ